MQHGEAIERAIQSARGRGKQTKAHAKQTTTRRRPAAARFRHNVTYADEVEAGGERGPGDEADAVERLGDGVVEVVDDGDAVALLQEAQHRVRADEPGAARHQHAPPARRRASAAGIRPADRHGTDEAPIDLSSPPARPCGVVRGVRVLLHWLAPAALAILAVAGARPQRGGRGGIYIPVRCRWCACRAVPCRGERGHNAT